MVLFFGAEEDYGFLERDSQESFAQETAAEGALLKSEPRGHEYEYFTRPDAREVHPDSPENRQVESQTSSAIQEFDLEGLFCFLKSLLG